MSADRPLHVRVAEALGWTDIHLNTWHQRGNWSGRHPTGGNIARVPRYDTDWAATGPLIQRFSFDLYRKVGDGAWSAAAWLPNDDPKTNRRVEGATPLLAACNLILALAGAGLLPEAR